ncbi:hypothetical protein HOF92_04265, partial [bacterium]|nr:hypothetical protein [bacterium]
LRIEFNPSSGNCELRYYLSKQPRAGSGAPQVYLRYDQNLEGSAKQNLQSAFSLTSLNYSDFIEKWHTRPVQYTWQVPVNQKPVSYVSFFGGFTSLEFENLGTPSFPRCPGISVVSEQMRNNEGQLFPNPFERPGDQIILYYHPETDPIAFPGQESLAAHLFLRDAYPDQGSRFNFDSEATTLFNKEGRHGIHPDSLVLYYDNELRTLPLQGSLINTNLEAQRLQFPAKSPEDSRLKPTVFSYYGTRNTTKPLTTDLILGRNQVPPEQLINIGLVRFDFLSLIGMSTDQFSAEEITRRNYTQIVTLDSLRFTNHLHTKSTINQRLGFSRANCISPGGFEGTNRCRHVSEVFPSGDLVRLSETFYLSQIEIDPGSNLGTTGYLNVVLEKDLRVYKVKIDFTNRSITVRKKNSYSDPEAICDVEARDSFPDRTCFPLESLDLISFTNLQNSGFLDDGFNYSNPEIYRDHLSISDTETANLYIEVSDSSNVEGFSLPFIPR